MSCESRTTYEIGALYSIKVISNRNKTGYKLTKLS